MPKLFLAVDLSLLILAGGYHDAQAPGYHPLRLLRLASIPFRR